YPINQAARDSPSRSDTNEGCMASSTSGARGGSLSNIASATAGSAGVDVETAVDVTIQDQKVHIVDSNVKGPLGFGLSALLIGRSSTTHQVIQVLLGVIDADYTGVVKIMVQTLTPPVFIPKGSKIAQLVPFKACVPNVGEGNRGTGGFGSTGEPQVYLSFDISRVKPECEMIIQSSDGTQKKFKMLIDTGADVTIISAQQWPAS
uniref:Peptidase A2 domain-containing protein n=1 Tax=Strix occidentalis caurina TaxID=311401 RepID=A0A8D0F1W6_STROC